MADYLKMAYIVLTMSILRRVSALLLAISMAFGPAFACAGYCPHLAQAAGNAAMADFDCMRTASHVGTRQGPMASSGITGLEDRDCAGSAPCLVSASLEKHAVAASAAISVQPPVIVFIEGPFLSVIASGPVPRDRIGPPALGPPSARTTPVSLNTTLRI